MRILGIDLVTTNSALAVAGDEHPAHSIGITQVVGPGEIAERPTLPSFLLLPSEHEVPSAQLQLPWSGPLRYAVGTFAREPRSFTCSVRLPAKGVGASGSAGAAPLPARHKLVVDPG